MILTTGRFTENDPLLARKVKSIEKSFVFLLTKIVQDVDNERKKKFRKTVWKIWKRSATAMTLRFSSIIYNGQVGCDRIMVFCCPRSRAFPRLDERALDETEMWFKSHHYFLFFKTYVIVKHSTSRSFNSIYCRINNDRSKKVVRLSSICVTSISWLEICQAEKEV